MLQVVVESAVAQRLAPTGWILSLLMPWVVEVARVKVKSLSFLAEYRAELLRASAAWFTEWHHYRVATGPVGRN